MDNIKSAIKPIKKVRVYRMIADELIDYIANNKLLPNEELPSEMELAETFGVSRTSIREAIIYLESLGIVTVEGNNRLVVNDSNLKSVNRNLLFAFKKDDITFKDIISLRIVLETGVLEINDTAIKDEYLDEMEEIIKTAQKKFKEGLPIHQEDFSFHSCLLKMSDNPIFSRFDIFLKEFFYKKPVIKEHKIEERSIKEHIEIYNYLKEQKNEFAKNLLREHLNRLYKRNFNN